MNVSLSERRQIENEMIFRRENEKIADNLAELKSRFIEDDYPELAVTDDITLHLLCECSDEKCEVRIPIRLSDYQRIHKNRDAFIIKPKHQVREIEKIIAVEDVYNVVEKHNSVAEPDDDDTLNATPVNNR